MRALPTRVAWHVEQMRVYPRNRTQWGRGAATALPLHAYSVGGRVMEPFHESDAEWPGFDDAFPGYDEL